MIVVMVFLASVGIAQTTWERHPSNPVLDIGSAGGWDDDDVSHPWVLFDGTQYKMWYGGYDSRWRIGYATSPDGVTWTKHGGNPVLDLGPNGAWDDWHVSLPCVLFDGTQYRMWYHGTYGSGSSVHWEIGYATSPDGISWTKHAGNPVFERGDPGAWDDFNVYYPRIIFDGDQYKMWYTGYDQTSNRIGYATSPDGVSWTKYAGNPVLDLGTAGTWDRSQILGSTVITGGAGYEMWYAGEFADEYKIGYATSPDGISWTKHSGNPVLDLAPLGEWDAHGLLTPMVLPAGDGYKMWYSGFDGGLHWRIGYATSGDTTNGSGTALTIELAQPASNVTVTAGATVSISWTGSGPEGSSVSLSRDSDAMWNNGGRTTIAFGQPVSGGFSWNTAGVPAGTYYIAGMITDGPGSAYDYAAGTVTITSPSTDGTRVYIDPAEQTVNLGDSVSVSVNIENVTNLAGFQFDIHYNPAILSSASVLEDEFLSGGGGTFCLEETVDAAAGTITDIACARTDQGGVSGSGTLITITFAAIGAGESYIRIQNIRLPDPNGAQISATTTDGSVTVTEYPPWDVNQDGRVDVFDLVIVGQYFGQTITTPPEHNPDVNRDGKVDVFDLVLVGQHFGEVYSAAAPPGNIWSLSAEQLPVLVKLYNVMEHSPNSDQNFLAVRKLLHKLISSANEISETRVFQNYPNPLNPETWIPFQLAEDSEVIIRIYSATGQLIRFLDLGHRAAGLHVTKGRSAYWDGRTDAGESVSSGIYFYNIQTAGYSTTRKMMVAQ